MIDIDELWHSRDRRLWSEALARGSALCVRSNRYSPGLVVASEIRGLGAAGALGLLALLYPAAFGTADQFVVKALRGIPDLPEAPVVAEMDPEQLTLADAIALVAIMRRRAAENNGAFGTSSWTPRMVDKVLWTYGR